MTDSVPTPPPIPTAPTTRPEPLDPGFQAFVDALADAEAKGFFVPWHLQTPQEIRAASAAIRRAAPLAQEPERRDLIIAVAGVDIPARLYTPPGAPAVGPGLVYFHGGGFTIGSIDTHDGIVARLAIASGVKILSVDYRLAPENPFPTAHDDALASVKWAFDNAASIGFDPTRIAVGGDSAGANLASSVCLDLRGDAQRKVRFQLLFYPNTTMDDPPASGSRAVYAEGHYLTLAGAHHFFRQYVTPQQAVDRRVDLLNRDDLAGLPPTFFSVGHCDILLDECLIYVDRLRAAGVAVELVTYPGYIHGFYGFAAQVPGVLAAFETAGAALANGLGAGA